MDDPPTSQVTGRASGSANGPSGRLKLFLGAAPGVGKTFEMLTEAKRKLLDGVDVVAAVIETHGRSETQALLGGIEVMPRQAVVHKGRTLGEMDLDAVLNRRPALVLVDELAHTNAPGSRHEKRYQDVLELLEAGIDVWTTMNVQHVESLNDVVARITRVRVRETVPDHVIDNADIELVDLAPEELVRRLEAGKVYVPAVAQRALQHFFSVGNLTALRELALRRTAQRVDEQMLSYMRAHAIAGPWGAADRVLAAVDGGPGDDELVRHAKRLADRLKAPWTVIHVETDNGARLVEQTRDRVAQTLRLAESLGGRALIVPGQRAAHEILAQAREGNITHIVVGARRRSYLRRLISRSTVEELLAQAEGATLQIVQLSSAGARPRLRDAKVVGPLPRPGQILLSAALVAVSAVVAMAIDQIIVVPNISFVFLAAVLVSALVQGLIPSLITSVLSVAAYNFLLTEPRYTFTVSQPENLVALAVFFMVAILTSGLMTTLRRQTLLARSHAKTTADLYAFSRKLAGAGDLYDVLWAAAYQTAAMLRADSVILMPGKERLELHAGYPPEDELDESDMAAAQWCFDHARPAGRGAATLPGAARLFLPMKGAHGIVGVLGLRRREEGPLSPPDRLLLDALLDQTAVAVERTNLALSIEQARLEAESERLRSTLLASVSHDLRTPLATIIGTLSGLRSFGDRYDAATRDAMLDDAIGEADRLERFVANLLDMIRLDAGAVAPASDPVDLADLLSSALRREKRRLEGRPVVTRIEPELPLLQLDFLLMEQVIVNILDNVSKYGTVGLPVEIAAYVEGKEVTIEIGDHGPGIPGEALERIFDKFYRVQGQGPRPAGTGLGLAVCRGLVEAMGGRIRAFNRQDGSGAIFKISFPLSSPAKEARR